MTTQELLQKCKVEGMVVKLPDVQLDRKSYLDVSKQLELIGGKWKGGKVSGFVFQEDPTALLEQIASGEKRNIKKEFQFFATPDELARELVVLADPASYDKILEPSAGQGAIIKAIETHCRAEEIFCYELMPLNQQFLKKIPSTTLLGDDFLQASPEEQYNIIIANPPFTKNQDIDHVQKMYEVCAAGGRIVSVMSNSWRTGSQKKHMQFREWLRALDAEIKEIPSGAFKESGTNIAACIVVIIK